MTSTNADTPLSTDVDKVLTDVVEAFLIVDIATRLRTRAVHTAVDTGVTWRQLAEVLRAAGIRTTPSGLHRRYTTSQP